MFPILKLLNQTDIITDQMWFNFRFFGNCAISSLPRPTTKKKYTMKKKIWLCKKWSWFSGKFAQHWLWRKKTEKKLHTFAWRFRQLWKKKNNLHIIFYRELIQLIVTFFVLNTSNRFDLFVAFNLLFASFSNTCT